MGVFNHSHGMNAADLADHLKQQSREHYGTLALELSIAKRFAPFSKPYANVF
ncbi:hypothetical protein [Neptunomonas sp.]|uniref:hypothetical protein n=1 Tax=Neptunomonas sp. TaxID=1971898 RepID=UPI00356746B5